MSWAAMLFTSSKCGVWASGVEMALTLIVVVKSELFRRLLNLLNTMASVSKLMSNAQLYIDMLQASLIIAQKYFIEIGTSNSSSSHNKKLVGKCYTHNASSFSALI